MGLAASFSKKAEIELRSCCNEQDVAKTSCYAVQALRPEFPVALGCLTGLLRLTLDVASFAPAAGGALPAALSRMTALQGLELRGDWRHTVGLASHPVVGSVAFKASCLSPRHTTTAFCVH